MKCLQYIALALGMSLLLSGVMINASALRKQPTSISLEIPSSMVAPDSTVIFTGTLTDSETGEGISEKMITIYREGPIVPEPIAEGVTGIDGTFTIAWTAEFGMNNNPFVTVLAQFDGDETAEPSRTGKMTFRLSVTPINLEITTDGNKNRYIVGSKAFFSVAIHDGMGNFVDPDVLKATYDGNFITLEKVDVGRYTFETPTLVKFEQHQFGVFVEQSGYTPAQKSLTITVFGAKVAKPVKVTATKLGDAVMVRAKNLELSPGKVYTLSGKLLNASPKLGSADNWQFSMDHTGTFIFKSIAGSLQQGDHSTYRVKVDGTASKLLWQVFDLHGVELASGTTMVKSIRAR
jgi:hypothetical protein